VTFGAGLWILRKNRWELGGCGITTQAARANGVAAFADSRPALPRRDRDRTLWPGIVWSGVRTGKKSKKRFDEV